MSLISSAAFAAADLLGSTLSVEGGLIGPDQVARIVAGRAKAQTAADYGFPRQIELRRKAEDAYRDAKAVWSDRTSDAAVTVRDILHHAFGFDDLVATSGVPVGDVVYPVQMIAGGRVPIVVAQPSDAQPHPMDRARHEGGEHGRYRSPALLLQDCLNASDAMMWGIVSDGRRFRLMRDSVRLGRPAFLEADLATILETDDLSSFTGLWLLVHRSRFGRDGTPADCALERWMEEAAATGVAVRERLRDGVEAALKALGAGVLADPAVRTKVEAGEIAVEHLFSELLRLVYRIIFLLTAEDRGLLHQPGADETAQKHYADGYAMRRAAERARRLAAWDRHRDAYEAAKIVFCALAHGEPRLALPALGGLFSDSRTPFLDTAIIGNAHWYEALFRIAWIADGKTGALHRVNWRDMQTEELGSVYESLLELVPRLADGGTALAFGEGAETKGNARKTTGSYYTPDSLVQALLDTALDPVLDVRRREGPESILSMTVIDPACGSGHFLLAAARRIAETLARERARLGGESFTPESYRHALREVVARCIHGVDRNDFAVELTKVALWIETVDPGKPLGFLGANILCGDSLLGLFDLAELEMGIPDAAYTPLTSDDKAVAKAWGKLNAAEKKRDLVNIAGVDQLRVAVTRHAASVRAMPEDTLEEVEKKRAAYASRDAVAERHRFLIAADIYVAAFILPKREPQVQGRPTVPTTRSLTEALRNTLYGPLEDACVEAARHARAFHWSLEFASVMAAGGFDVVVGNPPWDQIEVNPEGFLSNSVPEVASAKNKKAKDKIIANLKNLDPKLYNEFDQYRTNIWSVQSFVHGSNRFPTSSFGRLNTAPLFVELCLGLTSSLGNVGLIVPTGVATDSFNQKLFNRLIDEGRFSSLIDFENREGIFPEVHRSYKFCLLTLSHKATKVQFGFFLTNVSQMSDPRRVFALKADAISLLNPNTRTAPLFRSSADAELTDKIYRKVPVLQRAANSAEHDPWTAKFQLMFMMNTGSEIFRTAAELKADGFTRHGLDWVASGSDPAEERYVPLYEGKLIWIYDHRASSFESRGDERGHRVLPETAIRDYQNVGFEVEPFYWAPSTAVSERRADRSWSRRYCIGWRDITTAITERTMVATMLPDVGAGDTIQILYSEEGPGPYACLLANLCALPFDYVARQKISYVHLRSNIAKQLPALPPSAYTAAALTYITPRVLELTYTSHAMASFAKDLGYEGLPFAWDEDRRATLRAELDGWFAHAYGLNRDELRYVLDPADVMGPDYPSETFRVLKSNEEKRFGEYRTRRLVLAAYDDLATRRAETGLDAVDAALAGCSVAAQ